jgi:protein-disulfide isomerase
LFHYLYFHHLIDPRTMQPTQPSQNLAVPIAIVIAGILIAGAVVLTNKGAAPAQVVTGNQPTEQPVEKEVPKETYVIASDDHVLGNPNAPVRIIEYSDFECPFCKRFHPAVKQLMDEYGKNGEVALIYRHFPLESIHPQARPLAVASECAYEQGGDTAFWKAHDLIMGQSAAFNLKDLSPIAKAAGVDAAKLQACVDSGKYNSRVDRDFQSGANAGVSGTPFSFAVHKDGRVEKIGGAYPYANLKAIIDSLLRANP